ncbi:preprotein translocase subunit SecE [Granulicatella sp. zg-ZJ]|uniref:preprotein translocase subunit SecE n=1 Tax=unclassified Granulicatella TaxID=2630493 RepID=UPI0013C13140|nr:MULTISPECIES: preprotein translocase subunit SecE [unclassified Granulicatella]MBS4750080.1 preprotein translocase subunit SecE [Carnobacteriaceae bacterium zg-ZUI78]NEW63129.1 preprotein translocase subunit SecE [Granulicatella sp. zg-ZJ]NEW65764.1 preprotein translocase subunit SecE [Granulicatella sp. zg-84]QMI86273.1 preprotein translocase subunit SecE [Carnobacteriaceae bacterium zg-84]
MKFLKSVFQEMKLVTWPTGKELARLTGTVVSNVIAFALFFAVVDAGITALVHLLLSF